MSSPQISWSSPPIMISTPNQNATNPCIAIDRTGDLVSIWLENGYVKANTLPINGNWGTISTLSNSGASSAQLVMDPVGNATALWLEGNVVKTASLPLNGSWNSATSLSDTGAATPQIAVDTNGNLVAIWERNGYIESATKPFGQSWSLISMISSSDSDVPQVAIGADGTVFAIWHSIVSASDVIQTATSSINGSWQSPQTISDSSISNNFPSVSVDLNGNALAVWFQYNVVGNGYQNVATVSSYYTAGDSWSSARPISQPGIMNPANLMNRVAFDGYGNALVLWTMSYDGTTFNIETGIRSVNGTWHTGGEIVIGNLYAYTADLGINSFGDAVINYMFFDGSSLVIQSTETDITSNIEDIFTTPANLSLGNSNAYPRVATIANTTAIFAGSAWVSNNGTNNTIQAVTGTANVLPGPTNLAVTQNITNFGVFNEYYNTLTWNPSIDPTIIGYVIYRNGLFFTQVDGNTFQVMDNNAKQNGAVTYGIAALNNNFDQSPIVSVNFP